MTKKIVDKYMNFLRSGLLTQPGADLAIAESVRTGASVRARLALEIHRIDMEIPPPVTGPSWTEMWVASDDITALFATMGHYQIRELLAWQEMNCLGAGAETVPMSWTTIFDPPVLYAFEEIVFGARSAATGAANLFSGRVGFTWKKLSDAEFVEALEAWR